MESNINKYKRLVMLAGLASVTTAILFTLVKAGVWFFSGSSSMFASLTDSLFDLLASLINLLALRYSLTPPDKEHRFGHYKSQALASLAQAAFIGGSAVLLLIHGIEKIMHPNDVKYVELAIIVSCASAGITIFLVMFQSYVYKLTKSEAIGADRLHYMSDIILNAGVICSLFLSFYGYQWSDGLFASLIGLYILKGAWEIGMRAVQTLLDHSLTSAEMTRILQALLRVDGVKSVHDLRTHQAGPVTFIQGHVVLAGNISLKNAHLIINAAEKSVREIYPDADIILHMEPDEPRTYADVIFSDDSLCSDNKKVQASQLVKHS